MGNAESSSDPSAITSEEASRREKEGTVSPIVHVSNWRELKSFFDQNSSKYPFLFSAEDRYFLVKHTASWCPPCRKIQPYVESWRYQFKAVFVMVDADTCSSSIRPDSNGLPTFELYKLAKGKTLNENSPALGMEKITTIVGANKDGLLTTLNRNCQKF